MVRRRESGLTLVELSVVLVVVALLVAAAYPLLGNILEVMSSKGAAEQVSGAIRLARQFAITNGGQYCIEFQVSGGKHQYQIRPAASNACTGTAVDGYAWTDLSHSETVATTATTMVFDPVGNRVLPGGSGDSTFNIDTVPPKCMSTVTVTLYGGVRVQKC